jgi:hypothetical protein
MENNANEATRNGGGQEGETECHIVFRFENAREKLNVYICVLFSDEDMFGEI